MEVDKNKREDMDDEGSFAELLEGSFVGAQRLRPGQRVKAAILKITSDWIFLDLGRKSEGYLATKELLDKEGNITVKEGDIIEAYYLPREDQEQLFTTKLGGGEVQSSYLEEAWQSGIPVEGLVEKEIKGGFEVKIAGNIRGFCPYSQMGLQRVEDPKVYAGERLSFKITEFSERGRNLVLSNRMVLEEERRRQKESLKATLHEGMTVKGVITSIRNFGAFVNIGGVEGLIPISEISYARVEDVHEFLAVDQEVEVVVTQLDWDKERYSFSLKKALPDPWQDISSKYPEGSQHTGVVARLTNYGAFVTLTDGVDGLIHISKLRGEKRINHPREVLAVGQSIEVKITAVDEENKRLSLSPAAGEHQEKAAEADEVRKFVGQAGGSMGTLGDLLQNKLASKKPT
ncbi:30S ribosomal protein S1 [Desulfoferrobacter suflitae]|uniref:30S ribosomal protein S1 n=1 Tax=Desulfoferrobacter suflitae TaxID=2865782 RepID=UPI0021642E32|nr:30S ribosomal protein S1 [Desulfoferrobacter suflitae]MCK8601014.1 30S ribosomal protein S1 [Desulfoferrobacter suflitae]